MKRRNWLGIVVFVCAVVPGAHAAGAQARNNQTRLEREVAALAAIHDLMLTEDQLKALEPIAKDCAAEAASSTAPAASQGYRDTLRRLREALTSDDDDKLSKLEDKIDTLRENEKIEPDTDFPLRDSARSSATRVLAMLTTGQIANYIAGHSDDIPGATEVLLDGLTECRGQSDADFQSLRKEAAEQVGLLLGGLDRAAA